MKTRIAVFAAALAFIIGLGVIGGGLLRDEVIVDKDCTTKITSVKHTPPVTVTTKADVCSLKIHDNFNPNTPDTWVKVTPQQYAQATVGTRYQGAE